MDFTRASSTGSSEASSTGTCPVCGNSLASWTVLIEYERAGGERARYAECPDCGDVVHPD